MKNLLNLLNLLTFVRCRRLRDAISRETFVAG